MSFKSGKYKALSKGYIFDKLRNKGEVVVISKEFIENNPKFSASWLDLIEEKPEEKPKEKAK